ncbi:hypothetical protein Tco_1353156 [Tanacetum coccineum]
MLDSAETKTASKISQSKGTFNSTHDEFLNRFPSRNIEEIRDLDKKVTTRSEMVIDLDADERVTTDEMWCKTCKTNPQFVIPREWYVYTVFKMIDDKHVIAELLKKVLHNESVNDHYGISVGSSVGFGGVKDAFFVTGENKTPATVEKDNATGLDKRHWSLFTSHTLMTPKT